MNNNNILKFILDCGNQDLLDLQEVNEKILITAIELLKSTDVSLNFNNLLQSCFVVAFQKSIDIIETPISINDMEFYMNYNNSSVNYIGEHLCNDIDLLLNEEFFELTGYEINFVN